jgi:hypothetical protein
MLFQAVEAMFHFDLCSEQKTKIGTRFDTSFDTPSQRLRDRSAPEDGAEQMENPNLGF